jgi:hypothetical protein
MPVLISEGSENTLITGQQWHREGDSQPEVDVIDSIPDWIDPPGPNESVLESAARDGLLAIVDIDQPIDLSLIEATSFRRAEVGALAAQTLLYMGRADVFFGGDGVLSEAKQQAYWPDQYQALMAVVDDGPAMADSVIRSVVRMDAANAESIRRLLTGYSQQQLQAGGDEELVEFLDSPSMAVRVLALEHLHRITGETLYFRAEEDNAVRRRQKLNKTWVVRARKGDIRWPE